MSTIEKEEIVARPITEPDPIEAAPAPGIMPAIGDGAAWLVDHSSELVKGERQLSIMPYAAHFLRLTGLAIALAAFVYPLVSSGMTGVGGWFVDALLNLMIAFGFFVVAEAFEIIKRIDSRLPAVESVSQNSKEA